MAILFGNAALLVPCRASLHPQEIASTIRIRVAHDCVPRLVRFASVTGAAACVGGWRC